MHRKKFNEIEWLEFELLADFSKLKHGFFIRHGGISQAPYKSLNVAYGIGDNEEHVSQNLELIKTIMQQEVSLPVTLWRAQECHGKKVVCIDNLKQDKNPIGDALMSAVQGISLTLTAADCQIAFFYDPKRHIIANVHSGWRGSVQNIYAETIKKMQVVYGTHPKELLVCICPSLGPDDAEFIHFRMELPEAFWPFQTKPTYFDFWEISRQQLLKAGILPHHIEIAGLSTYSNTHDFFSYRKEKNTGRHAACIMLL